MSNGARSMPRSLRFSSVSLGASTLVCTLTTAALAGAPSHFWQRNPRDPRWVQGQVDVATPASVVWQRIAQVRDWPSVFSDISAFSVDSRSADGAAWTVRFASRTVGHGVHPYSVALDPGKHFARVVIDAPGLRAAGYISVEPIDDTHSRVSYSAFVDKAGLLGLFLSESRLRANQERLVEHDLRDMERSFGAAAGSP